MNYSELATENQPGGLYGVYVGIVTDIEDPEDWGRVKLEFPWRDCDDESRWARIATTMAGDDMGTYFLPEPEDEVLVAFGNGDIHEPYIIGSLWNGKQLPPQENDEENPIREIRSRTKHTLRFDDDDREIDEPGPIQKPGKIELKTGEEEREGEGQKFILDDENEKILIEDEHENKIQMDENGITIESPETIKISADMIEITAQKDVDVSGKSLEASADTSAKVSSTSMDLKAKGNMKLKGKLINLN